MLRLRHLRRGGPEDDREVSHGLCRHEPLTGLVWGDGPSASLQAAAWRGERIGSSGPASTPAGPLLHLGDLLSLSHAPCVWAVWQVVRRWICPTRNERTPDCLRARHSSERLSKNRFQITDSRFLMDIWLKMPRAYGLWNLDTESAIRFFHKLCVRIGIPSSIDRPATGARRSLANALGLAGV